MPTQYVQLGQQYVEALTPGYPASGAEVQLGQQFVEALTSGAPAAQALQLGQQFVEVLVPLTSVGNADGSSSVSGIGGALAYAQGEADGSASAVGVSAIYVLPPPSATLSPIRSDFCPTQEQLAQAYLTLLPRGRAWAEGGPGRESGGVIHAVIEALASVFAFVHAQICALALELFCATATLTLDLWNLEYGLPDGCDPYQDVCDKIAAFGAPLCATYQGIAATLGWSISCGGSCGSEAGCAEAGCSVFGPVDGPGVLIVAVDLAKSSAYVGAPETIAEFGCFEHGLQPSCGVDLRSLNCVLQRIVGAHVELVYAVSDFP